MVTAGWPWASWSSLYVLAPLMTIPPKKTTNSPTLANNSPCSLAHLTMVPPELCGSPTVLSPGGPFVELDGNKYQQDNQHP